MPQNKAFRIIQTSRERAPNSVYYLNQWRPSNKVLYGEVCTLDEVPFVTQEISRPTVIEDKYRLIIRRLGDKYQGITTHERILGGEPHIKGTRVSVAHVLGHLYHLGSIDAVAEEFRQSDIQRDHIADAVAYAHDFMEMACDPSEDD